MRRKGFIFTLDALLSLLLIMIFVSSIVAIGNTVQTYPTYMREQDKYIAEDTLTVLRTVSLKELVPPQKIEEWLVDGTLNTTLVSPDMSPLEIVSTYWATEPLYPSANLRHKAEIILGYILNRTLKGYNYELMINNYTSPYLRKVGSNSSKALDISPATLTLSGYAYNQTPRGYMARAFLTKAEVIREELYGWMRVLAGADDGYNTLTITRILELPQDADILYADGKFVTRRGEHLTLYINSQLVDSRWGQINRNDLDGYLRSGKNIISLVFSRGYSEIGSASGTTLYIKYKTDSLSVENPGLVRVYDVTSSRTGIMYLFEMFVPGNISEINMRFKVRNINTVRLYYGFGERLYLLLTKSANSGGDAIVEFTDSEIRDAVNNVLCGGNDCYEEFKANLSRMVFDFVVGFDAYYYDGYWYYEGDTYNDAANRERKIYGYPESYVHIKYVPRTVITMYSIPISIYFPYYDPRVTYAGLGLQVSYELPPNAEPWYADYWVGYTFYDYSTYQNLYENYQRFYRGPLGRYAIRVAYTRLYNWMMIPGQTNYFEIRMTNGNSRVRDYETRGIIKYFIQGYASYGDVFPRLLQGYPRYKGYNLTYYYNDGSSTYSRSILVGDKPYKIVSVDELDPTTYAVDDAILRLFNNLNYANDLNPGEWKSAPFDGSQINPIDVDLPGGVQIAFASMGDIPGLFKPITITLRVWREQ